MAQQPKEEKRLDFNSLPRGAISIKGLPVSRNTRLPSIRSPRDLTLGAAPKRTFVPNIPVRREKKPQVLENVSQVKQETVRFDKKANPHPNDRGRGRGRGKANIIQTQGAIFSEGIAVDSSKKKVREGYQRSDYASRVISIKKEREDCDVASVSKKMVNLFRDDFIDDGDDEDKCDASLKPVTFPVVEVKKEAKTEIKEIYGGFNPDIAEEMGFDVKRVAQFIKKEEGVEEMEQHTLPTSAASNEIADLLNNDANLNKLVLIKFPEFVSFDQKMDDSKSSGKRSANEDLKVSDNQNADLTSINSLPEGCIGKLQILKSGKTRLLIGATEFTLNFLEKSRSKHEVVSVNTESNTGDLTVLGYLEHKMNFLPNVDCLLA